MKRHAQGHPVALSCPVATCHPESVEPVKWGQSGVDDWHKITRTFTDLVGI